MCSLGDIADDAHTVEFISSVLSDKSDFLYRVLGEKDNFIQQNAVYSLGKIGKPAVEALLKMLKQMDNDAEYLRADVVDSLGNIKDPRVLEPIIEALRHHNKKVRLRAIIALEKFNNKRAFEAIYTALWDKKDEVRNWAINILSRIKYCRAYNALKTISETDRDHSIRSSAKDALKMLEEKVYKTVEHFANGKPKLINVCTCSGDGETVIEKRYFNEENKLIKIENLNEHTETRFSYFPKEELKGYVRAMKPHRLEKIYGDLFLFYGNLLKDGVRTEAGYKNGQSHGKVVEWDVKGIIKKQEIWENGRLIKKIK
jgi:antitoxin component YwqK of YwqJK toxin-antitoxin module